MSPALEGGVEDRIGDQINWPDAAPNDRPDLTRLAGRLPIAGIEAELEIDSVKEASLRRVRDDELGAQLSSVDQNAPVASPGVHRRISTKFEPIDDAVGPFGDTAPRVVRQDASGKIR